MAEIYSRKNYEEAGSPAHVSIPYGVTTIGDSAFERCESLQSVHIPDSVTTIGKNVFLQRL